MDWLIMAGLGGLAIALRLIPGPRLIDDAYITYRYAKNALDGVGFVYNPGEAVLGTTTPLYGALMILAGAVAGSESLPLISPILNALADGIGVAALYLIGMQAFNHRLPASALGALWAVSPRSVTFAVGGMETSVAIALTLCAHTAFLYGRPRLTALLTGLAVLARPDTLIWAGPLGVAMAAERWRDYRAQPFLARLPLAEAGIFLAVAAPWVIYAWLAYGSPVPHSIAAKSLAYILPATQGLERFVQHFSTPFHEYTTFGSAGIWAGFLAYLPLSALGGMFLVRADRRLLLLALFPALYIAVFAAANPLIFRWYIAPPLPFYMLMLVSGVWGLATRIAGERRGRWALIAVCAAWIVLSFNEWRLHPDHGLDRPAPDMAWHKLEILYEQAASSLRPEVDDNTVIAAGDIGAVGWFSGAKVLDTLGLISPEATSYYPLDPSALGSAPYAVATDLILDKRPDFLIILETYGRNTLLRDERFWQMYRLREKIETDIYESDGMLIFERSDRSGGG